MTAYRLARRSANILIKQHGQVAPIHAAMRAGAMLEKGDLDARLVNLLNDETEET